MCVINNLIIFKKISNLILRFYHLLLFKTTFKVLLLNFLGFKEKSSKIFEDKLLLRKIRKLIILLCALNAFHHQLFFVSFVNNFKKLKSILDKQLFDKQFI